MKRGFTLLELIIVIIILAILASLAIPRFISTTERARAAEALMHLGVIRGAMDRYWVAASRVYTGAVLANTADCGPGYNLDIDCPNNPVDYPRRLFNYVLSVAGANAYTVVATRVGSLVDTITITQDGAITGAGVFASVKLQ